MKLTRLFVVLTCFVALTATVKLPINQSGIANTDWPEYLGGPDRNHYSPLRQIDSTNVHQLRVAWTYHSLDSGQMQCNPIIVNGTLYGMTASTQPIALDAATGQQRWRWQSDGPVLYNNSRGVTYWQDGQDGRILFTNGPWLYALDARTGTYSGVRRKNG